MIAAAKKAGFPKQSIENAIAHGQGLSASGVALESFLLEFMIPASGIAALVECQTDNKMRTLQDVREILKFFGATQTPTAYMFERRGKLTISGETGPQQEDVFDHAVDAGAVDVESQDESLFIYTEPSAVCSVAEKLEAALGLQPAIELVWEAKDDARVKIEDAEAEERIQRLISRLEDDPSVQNVNLNAI